MTPNPQDIHPAVLQTESKNHFNSNGIDNNAYVEDEILPTNLPSKLVRKEIIHRKSSEHIKETTESIKSTMDFDDLLPHIGEFGRYQKILFLLMIPFAFFVAFVYFAQIFMTLVPEEHWCNVPELEGLSVEDRKALAIPRNGNGTKYDQCAMYAVNYTELLENGIRIADASWPVQPCKYGWEFNRTEIQYDTIATELEWVCENENLPIFAQSIFFCGAIVGGLLFGWIADRFGRIPALVGCNLMGFIAGVATAFTASFWAFSLCRFFVGFAFDNCFTMMYILVLEYVGPKWRTFVANMSIAIFFTFASCILPWIAYYLNDWQMFTIVTSAPLLLAVFTPWAVPESARWLVAQGQIDRAIGILKKFEKINGSTVKPEMYQDFHDSCVKMQAEDADNSRFSIMDLFKTPRLRKITILLLAIWMAISLVFDGHIRNVSALGLNVFITFTVAAATECPADILLTYTLDVWGRRWLAFGSMVLSGVFSLLAISFDVGIYSAVMAILGRFFVNIAYNIGLQYAAELLPTVIRAQGVAFIHIMGYVANIIAPLIFLLSKVSSILPLLILGIVGIIGGILSLFLPETLDKDLPQTLDDGERFGIGQKLLDFPCCERKHDDDVERPSTFTRSTSMGGSVGASLRASTRGELGSSMLRRSLRTRQSTKSMNGYAA